MKMTLRNRIALSLELLSEHGFKSGMHENDKDVVFYSSVLLGSKLSRRYNDIMMNRNAIPLWWYSSSRNSDCVINSSFKKAFIQIVDYLERDYNITPGRTKKLLDIYWDLTEDYADTINMEGLSTLLRDLNNLRTHLPDMTESEIYDFSFDVVYDFINEFSTSHESIFLSLVIMYWIQRECHLIPLAVTCEKHEFVSALDTKSEVVDERTAKKNFRLFMRKQLDLHLKRFIQIQSNGLKIKFTSRDRILNLIKENPHYTAKTMASCLGLSVQAVQKQIAKLKAENRIKRIGPDHGGKWAVVQKDR